jgi:hypothetical protein
MSTSAAFWCSAERRWSAMREVPGDQCRQSSYWPGARTNCDRCTCQQGGPRHLGASHARRGLSSAAAAGRLIEHSASAAPKGRAKEVMDRQLGPTTEANPLRGMRIKREIEMGAWGGGRGRTIRSRPAAIGRANRPTQTCNRHDSPKPKTLLTRGGRPHNSSPAKCRANSHSH